MRWPVPIVLALLGWFLPLTPSAQAGAQTLRPIERSPAQVVPGDLVTVSSSIPCEEPTGERHLFAVIGLHRAGQPSGEPLAGAAVDSEGVYPTQFPGRVPDYTPDSDDGGAFRPDGTWTARMFVPYGTPPGTYEVRADCRADFVMTPSAEILYEYGTAPLTVLAWPANPPVRRDVRPWGMTVDGQGVIHTWGYVPSNVPGPSGTGSGRWPGRDVARGLDVAQRWPCAGGLIVDAHGGLHSIEAPILGIGSWLGFATPSGAPSWPRWDIARGVALIPDGCTGDGLTAGGLILDGWGGLHPFRTGNGRAPTVTPGTGPYWKGWDIARDVVINPDGQGGYVLDAWGGLHGFGLDGHPAPPKPAWNPYWKGWDIARGVVAIGLPEGRSGYVVDAWGGLHPYSVDRAFLLPPVPGPYWVGQDVVRGATVHR
jgi:hypothetical protein